MSKSDSRFSSPLRYAKYYIYIVSIVGLVGCCSLTSNIVVPVHNSSGDTLRFRQLEVGARASHATPVWSPDGAFLAVTVREDSGEQSVWVIDAVTLRRKRFGLDVLQSESPILAWRSNLELAVISGRRLFFINVSTDEVAGISTREIFGYSYVFDPRDHNVLLMGQVVQRSQTEYQQDLVRYNIITQELAFLTDTPNVEEFEPRVSSDGKLLAYYYAIGGGRDSAGVLIPSESDLIIEIDGVRHELKVPISDSPYKLAIGPGGRRIAFVNHGQNDRDRPTFPVAGIYTVNVVASEEPTLFISQSTLEDGISALAWSEATGRIAIITVFTPGQGNSILISDPIASDYFDTHP